jgi:serine protease Do
VLPRLIRDGKITRGWIGIAGGPADKPDYGQLPEAGARIGEIHADTPAAKAGLVSGDRVIEIDGQPIENFEQLRARIGERAPKERVALTVLREGKRQVVDVELAERPNPEAIERMGRASIERQHTPSIPAPDGDLFQGQPARLGVEIDADLRVLRVVPASVAERLGLRSGDVIREINGRKVDSIEAIIAALERDRSKVEVEVGRGEGSFVGSLSSK